MYAKTIHAEYKRTFNLGDYESVTLTASIYLTPDEDENPEAVLMYGFSLCKEAVKENIPPNYKNTGATIKSVNKIAGVEVI